MISFGYYGRPRWRTPGPVPGAVPVVLPGYTPEPLMDDDRPFQPDWVSPPGDTIARILEERGLTRSDLAAALYCTEAEVDDLLAGTRVIDVPLAARLSDFLGSTSRFWLRRDAQYRSECVRLGRTPGVP